MLTIFESLVCYFRSTGLLLFELYSVQVWVGVDFHRLLNDSVICVNGVSAAEAWRAVVAGNCCAERAGITLGWTPRCRPALVVFSLSPLPFHPASLLRFTH